MRTIKVVSQDLNGKKYINEIEFSSYEEFESVPQLMKEHYAGQGIILRRSLIVVKG